MVQHCTATQLHCICCDRNYNCFLYQVVSNNVRVTQHLFSRFLILISNDSRRVANCLTNIPTIATGRAVLLTNACSDSRQGNTWRAQNAYFCSQHYQINREKECQFSRANTTHCNKVFMRKCCISIH